MYNVLIADDEKLIRKGLIALLPWSKFDMQVIGEANNGKVALEFMKENTVDFLFVDLTMPIMDGFELMKSTRLQHPDVWIVVLTCHQDFDYVQEALRLGAIDYIVKTQFEQDKIDDIFMRIIERVAYEKMVRAPLSLKAGLRSGYVFVNFESEQSHAPIISQIEGIDVHLIEISKNSWFVSVEAEAELNLSLLNEQLPREDWAIISIMSSSYSSQSELLEYLRYVIPSYIYYEYKPDQYYYELAVSTYNQRDEKSQAIEEIREAWNSQEWMNDEARFDSIVRMVGSSRIDLDELAQILKTCLLPWMTIAGEENDPVIINETMTISTWHHWLQKLHWLREHVQLRMKNIPYSPAVITSISRALIYIQEDDGFSFTRDDLASKLLMSSSYFSQCFKGILGIAYGDYVKLRKMMKTALLLEQSDEPIYQIAFRSGFKDEKYFSKMFRSHFGLNPTEYRKKMKKRATDIL